tara:strand:+ start:4042 stop:4662 length:621 start_codon:yes stop_codon:yes gene_type:complete
MVVLMHIGGAPGSGKTHLGKQIKSIYPEIKVIDSDSLKDRFIEKPIERNMEIMEKLTEFKSYGRKSKKQINLEKEYEDNYVNYIKSKFNKLHKQDQKYILVGHFFMFSDMHIDIPAKHKIYLDVKSEELFSRRNGRLIKDISKNREYFMSLVDNGEEFWNYNYLWKFSDQKDIEKQLEKTKKFYLSNKYKAHNELKIKQLLEKDMK